MLALDELSRSLLPGNVAVNVADSRIAVSFSRETM
jgi:hypothetical protein